MPDSLKDQWEPIASLVPFEEIEKALTLPQQLIGEPVKYIFPSMALAPDGPKVKSCILVTETYICEVRIGGDSTIFDVALLATVGNYRVAIGHHAITFEEPATPEAPSAEKKKRTMKYLSATVHFAHTVGLTTDIVFIGEVRDVLLKRALAALPIDLLVKSQATIALAGVRAKSLS